MNDVVHVLLLLLLGVVVLDLLLLLLNLLLLLDNRDGHVQLLLVEQFFALLDLFPLLGSSVLEPDFHLPFGESQAASEFGFATNGDVATVVELFLQFEPLMIRVDDAVLVFGPRFPCWIDIVVIGRFLHPFVGGSGLLGSADVVVVIIRSRHTALLLLIHADGLLSTLHVIHIDAGRRSQHILLLLSR